MKVILKIFLITLFFNLSFAGWQGARMINGSFGGGSMGGVVVTDKFGFPWVFWSRLIVKFTKWNGSDWEEPRIAPDTICHPGGFIADFTFDQDNTLFLVYPTHDEQNHCDVFSACYDPVSDSWELPKQINDQDTTILDEFQPRISIGGGEVWATWGDESTTATIIYKSNIKAGHWNRQLQDWEPEMTVNPDSITYNRIDWFSEIEVDTNGIPHIVWGQVTDIHLPRIRYSKYENNSWLEPVQINNPDSVIPIGPYDVFSNKIVVDNQNILHAIFNGYRPPWIPDSSLNRVYYTENSGSGWKSPIAFDTFSTPGAPVWYCDIAADRPDNIWVVWSRGNDGYWQIFASHFNGNNWSPEERIDDGITQSPGPFISLNGNGEPFVIWACDTTGTGHGYAVYYNRYVSSAIEEEKKELPDFRFVSSFNRIEIKYTLPHKDHIKVKVYDINGRMVDNLLNELQEAGDHTFAWNKRIPQGVYFIHFETSQSKQIGKVIIIR